MSGLKNSEQRRPARSHHLWPALAIALLTFVAYGNTFRTPFVFDDMPSVFQNPSILNLRDAWAPPAQWGVTVSGRPILNVSLAINYAISGFSPWSYHLFNLVVHLGAGLLLYGFIRRTLLLPTVATRLREHGTGIAAVSALLWSVHPLQTESITYVIQRAESLMGFFYLLTFYAVARSITSSGPKRWHAVAVVSCILGAGTKEVIATAPILVLLYDRAFVSGSFRNAWTQRRGLYTGLAFTWVVLGALVASTGGDRGGTFNLTPKIATTYWASQTEAIVEYLRLALWPHPLVFERGLPQVPAGWHLPVYAFVVAAVVLVTFLACWMRPRLGFFGAWFLAILAPTSILPGTIQAVVEHRMYLSLAAVVVGLVCLATWRFGRGALVASLALAPLAAAMTYQRNAVYRDDLTLWLDTLAHAPRSAIAQANVGFALFNRGNLEEAIDHYKKAIEIDPTPPNSHYNLGLTDVLLGRNEEALKEFATTVRLNPRHYPAHYEAGKLLRTLGRRGESREQLRLALAIRPDLGALYQELGLLATDEGNWKEAKPNFEQAWRLDPRITAAAVNLGVAEYRLGDFASASRHLEYAISAGISLAEAHFTLGQVRLGQGDRAAARREFDQALRLDPKYADAQLSLGLLFAQDGEIEQALPHLATAATLAPKRADAHGTYANALFEVGKLDQAIDEYQKSIALDPANARVQANFANALVSSQRLADAQEHFAAAARLDPADAKSADMAARLRAYLAQPKLSDGYPPR